MNFPILQNDLYDLIGDPRDLGWEQENMVRIDLRDFEDAFDAVKDFEGEIWNFRIYGHKLLEQPLRKVFGLIRSNMVGHELKTYDGCWNIRLMKGSNRLSIHSWGLALDINAGTNPFRSDGRLITDFSDEFVKCFMDSGFEWGGLWDAPKDPMHFQLPWTRRWSSGDGPIPYKE